jgi:AhpD family alkylhydroperoxidase
LSQFRPSLAGMTTDTRIQPEDAFPAAYKDAIRLSGSTQKIAAEAGLDPALIELVRIRASQMNACAFCVDMHTRDARRAGESERRLSLLAAWHETNLYSAQERVALELTETLTRLAETRDVPDELYARALQVFDEKQYSAIVYSIAMINFWNRISVASHKPLPD